jgi:hypothetical protein
MAEQRLAKLVMKHHQAATPKQLCACCGTCTGPAGKADQRCKHCGTPATLHAVHCTRCALDSGQSPGPGTALSAHWLQHLHLANAPAQWTSHCDTPEVSTHGVFSWGLRRTKRPTVLIICRICAVLCANSAQQAAHECAQPTCHVAAEASASCVRAASPDRRRSRSMDLRSRSAAHACSV